MNKSTQLASSPGALDFFTGVASYVNYFSTLDNHLIPYLYVVDSSTDHRPLLSYLYGLLEKIYLTTIRKKKKILTN